MSKENKVSNYIKEGLLSLKTIRQDKAEYKQYLARVEKLPGEYKMVYKEIEKYVWSFSDNSGKEAMNIIGGLLELFEEGVDKGLSIKEITGENIGDFSDNLAKEINGSWANRQKDKLNDKFKEL